MVIRKTVAILGAMGNVMSLILTCTPCIISMVIRNEYAFYGALGNIASMILTSCIVHNGIRDGKE